MTAKKVWEHILLDTVRVSSAFVGSYVRLRLGRASGRRLLCMESSLIIPIVVCDDIETRLIFVVDVRDSASTSHNYSLSTNVRRHASRCGDTVRQIESALACGPFFGKGAEQMLLGRSDPSFGRPSSSRRWGREESGSESLPWQRGAEDEGSTFAYGKPATLAVLGNAIILGSTQREQTPLVGR